MGKILTLIIGLMAFAPAAYAAHVGDADKGAKIFKKCKACHKVGDGAKNGVGPHLNLLFGRVAGTLEGAKFSKGMVRMGNDGLIWTAETLEAFLENPKAMVSKTRMSFKGLSEHEDREDVLAYLRQFSDDPQNIPEAEPTAEPSPEELPPEILAIVGDTAYGQYLSGECVTCHQSSGADDGIPSITGWPNDDFVVALHAYKNKLRPHPVMQLVTSRLSNDEIAALAAYFRDLE
ncbi:MAG: c-type cytochrome [Paracoccaceae bacterium]